MTHDAIGFGTWPFQGDDAERAVATAVEAGYRLIDTATKYGNEAAVGRGLRASGVDLRELRIQTKLRGDDHGDVRGALGRSLEALGVDALDAWLIHWPLPMLGRYPEAWAEMVRLREEGLVREIGVSNFLPEHLERLIGETSVVPAVNQIELHPHLQQHAAREYHAEQGIATEAYSPLGSGKGILEIPAIVAIAQKHNRTPAQVVLRWHLQLGNVVIPKSVTPARIAENIDVFDFSLDAEDLAAISALNEDRRVGSDPAKFNAA